jgi:predicted amidophosphoribosyltransferase
MACRNLCERLDSKITVGESRYGLGKKYCRRCEVHFLHDGSFCPCCGMRLRLSPTNRKDKQKLRQNQRLNVLEVNRIRT